MQFFYKFCLTKVPEVWYNENTGGAGRLRRAKRTGDFSPARSFFNTILLMQFQQSFLQYFSKSVYWLYRVATEKCRGLGCLQTDICETIHS